jgi:hypothetical protein
MCDGFTDGKDELMLVKRSAKEHWQNFRSSLWFVECGFQLCQTLGVVSFKLIEPCV